MPDRKFSYSTLLNLLIGNKPAMYLDWLIHLNHIERFVIVMC